MEEKIKNILANEPELLQYYYNNADKINDLIHKFNISYRRSKKLDITVKSFRSARNSR